MIENQLFVGNANVVGRVEPNGQVYTFDAAAAVDQGGSPNVVRIPATGHGLSVGDSVLIAGTTNYNGNFPVVAVSDADNFDIESSYTAETFAVSDSATITISSGINLEDKYTIQSFVN